MTELKPNDAVECGGYDALVLMNHGDGRVQVAFDYGDVWDVKETDCTLIEDADRRRATLAHKGEVERMAEAEAQAYARKEQDNG